MGLMNLIKYFYSTFIHYFLIKPVDEYFYMFISKYMFTAQAVSICKEEYLTPLVIFNVKMIAGPNLNNWMFHLNVTKVGVFFLHFGSQNKYIFILRCSPPLLIVKCQVKFGGHRNDCLDHATFLH